MMEMLGTRGRRRFVLLIPLIVALVALLPATVGAEHGARKDVHPAVDIYADLYPGEMIPVIVKSDDADLPQWVADNGGDVVQSFDIVDGFQAEMPVAAVRALDFSDRADWISLDAPLMASHRGDEDGHDEEKDGDDAGASRLATAYPFAVNAVPAWEEGVTGEGVGVAVIDTGVNKSRDFRGRLIGSRNFSEEKSRKDGSGHGTWVAGIIAGDDPRGRYIGVAPGADLLSVKVAGSDGSARVSDVIEALQWVVANKDRYDIRVVNISLNSAIADSYLRDPLSAAVEQAWFQGIVVVVSAGNLGAIPFAVDHAPANDPYVITAGAFDDMGTPDRSDDVLADWSGRGVTVDGYAKPEVVAPGVDIVATSGGSRTTLVRDDPDRLVDRGYISLSGTSASAAVVSGAVALMLEEESSLTPDEVKFRLMATGAPIADSGVPGIDASAAAFTTVEGTANSEALPNEFIDPATGEIMEDSILWRSILWRSILWRSILWRSTLVSG